MKRYRLKPKQNYGTVLILDGKFLFYRSQYSPELSGLKHEDMPTGLLFGFFNTILSLIKKFDPTNIVIMWDGKGSARKERFPEYKKKKDWSELTQEEKDQIIFMKSEYENLIKLCRKLGFASHIMDKYEADDLIALFVQQNPNAENIIVTSDEDMYQCLNKNTRIYDLKTKRLKTEKWFVKTYEIKVDQWVHVKTYGGCKSDAVPGIPQVGEKTAIKIINGDKKALKKLDRVNPEDLKLWKWLVKLPNDDIKDMWLPHTETKLNIDKFMKFCQKYRLNYFLEQLTYFKRFGG